jgi:hypothetical protein
MWGFQMPLGSSLSTVHEFLRRLVASDPKLECNFFRCRFDLLYWYKTKFTVEDLVDENL